MQLNCLVGATPISIHIEMSKNINPKKCDDSRNEFIIPKKKILPPP